MSLEKKLLSALTTPEKIAQVYEMGLRTEAFEEPFSDHIYDFIVGYWIKSQMASAPTLSMITTERPGFPVYEAVEEEPWWLAEQLMKRAIANHVQEMLIDASTAAQDDPIAALHNLREESYLATEKIVPRHSRSDMSDYEARRRRYRAREEGREISMSYGLPGLDEHTGGLLPGELCVIGAYSGVGKTLMLIHIAALARKVGYTPIIFTLEMSVEDIEEKMDAMVSGVSYNRLTKRRLTPQEQWWLHSCQEYVTDNMGQILIEKPVRGERTVAHLISRARQVKADLVLIDQLSHVESTRKFTNEKMRKADIMETLHDEIGKDSLGKLPCIMAAQLKRESLDRPELRLDDFADAAEVERFSDFALGIARDRQLQTNRMARMEVLKGRRGGEASWILSWDLVDKTLIQEYERIQR